MKTKTRRSKIRNEDGMATLETIPLVIIFVVLIGYMFGAFGVIHTGILQSIAARNYAFEIFRHRTDLTYLRDGPGRSKGNYYSKIGTRVHAVSHERHREFGNKIYATERRLAMGLATGDENDNNTAMHNEAVFGIAPGKQNTTIGVSPVWVMTQYGICLNATCTRR